MGRKESNQTKQRSGPTDLDPNRLTLIVFLKDFFEKLEKKSIDDNICNGKLPIMQGAQWLSGRVLDSRPKGRGFEPHQRHSACPFT